MSCLHTCNSIAALTLALPHIQSGDALLLLENAVCAAALEADARMIFPDNCARYVLAADRQARGLAQNDDYSSIDYAEFVNLSLRYDKVLAWN